MTCRTISLTLATLVSLVCPSQAAVITTLFDTGVDANRVLLGDGTIDPHYILLTSADPSFPGPNAFAVNNNSIVFPAGWLGNGPNSRWIGPRADGLDMAAGNYVYRTTFDLTGFQPATAVVTGRWAIDNSGVDILINGASTGISRPGELNFFNFSAPFTINSGFVPGINTLDFIITNLPTGTPNPTGLRVELSGTAVPEPSSMVMGGLVVAGAAWRRIRRKQPNAK